MPLDGSADIVLPDKLVPAFTPPRGAVDFRAFNGGRGGGKSLNAALMASVWGYAEPLRVLCTREFQASIRNSFHAELRDAIAAYPFLAAHYDVGVDYIRGRNGTEFLFKGLRHSIGSIKSTAGIDLTIIEEAEDVPESSWVALLPTVMRTDRAEVWPIWNARLRGSPVDKRFIVNPMPRSIVTHINYSENPFFPEALNRLRQTDQEQLDDATYQWIWEGAYYERSAAQVFADRFEVRDFDPENGWDGPYQGGDFGFANDPTAAVRCWINDATLYIEHEAGKTGLELDHMAGFLDTEIPKFSALPTRWDSARPESISFLRRHGLPRTEAVQKWPGSVEDGIQAMRAFKRIVVHPRCNETANEFRAYSYKTNDAGDVLPKIIDANNHYIDAIRYAIAPLIRQRGTPTIRSL